MDDFIGSAAKYICTKSSSKPIQYSITKLNKDQVTKDEIWNSATISFKSLLNLASLAAIFLSLAMFLLLKWRNLAIAKVSWRRFLTSALDILMDLRGASFKE